MGPSQQELARHEIAECGFEPDMSGIRCQPVDRLASKQAELISNMAASSKDGKSK